MAKARALPSLDNRTVSLTDRSQPWNGPDRTVIDKGQAHEHKPEDGMRPKDAVALASQQQLSKLATKFAK